MGTSSGASSAQPNNPLLTTKLYIPPPRQNLVPRPRLARQLDRAFSCPLTLISAPPGFGKTTLLSEWASQRISESASGRPVAWLSLDEGDNTPAQFLAYLIAALQTAAPEIGHTLLVDLQKSDALSLENEAGCAAIINQLGNEIAKLPDDVVLVLDDYHVIAAPAIHHAITCLLDRLPPSLHLIIAGRTEPPLPLPRLRVRHQLIELDTADLRFTPDEAVTFLKRAMGLELSAQAVAALETRTEGWIAGLQMAALSMQNCEDIPGFIAAFRGSHRYVFDYLADEVLHRQPEGVQKFLRQTSILNRLTAPLCDALVDNDPGSAQRVLEQLEQANLFIVPLDDERRWYRYHHLFADFLRDQLQRQVGVAGVAGLHRRAAAWYEQNDLPAEAVGHALITADVERAVRLVEQGGKNMLRQSELSTLLKWLQALPAEVARARARLSLFHGWALVFTGQLEAAETWLQTSDLTLPVPGELTALQGSLAFFKRDFAGAIDLFRRAFAELPEENLFLRGAVALSMATACNLQGDVAGAGWAFEQGAAISRANGNSYLAVMALCNLASLHLSQAHLHRAAQLYRQALQWADEQAAQGEIRPANTGRANVGLGEIFYQWNDLAAAGQYLKEAIAWGRRHGDTITLMQGYLTLAQVEQAQGEVKAAFTAVTEAEKYAQANNLPSWGIRLAAYRVRLWLAQDQIEPAARWLEKDWLELGRNGADDSAGYPDELRRVEDMTRARLWIAQARPEKALELLAKLLEIVDEPARAGCALEIRVLQAVALQAGGKTSEAESVLAQAILQAEPENYRRLFLDAGLSLIELLRRPAVRDIAPDYVGALLVAFKQAQSAPAASETDLIDPLSERELELLALIANGLSNRQIADELVLTVGTVKWHLSNIYSKLGVSSRTQAVARARDLQLL